jgi:glycosyltransferase involved in cell wall biosynthesis
MPPHPGTRGVSIVICNFNYGHFLAQAIDSALAQDGPVAQVVVVDDGSTDNSVAVAQAYGDRIQLVTQPNGGQIAAYNTGFSQVTGEIVVFLDSDDTLHPQAASSILRAMADPAVTRVQYRLKLMDREGHATGGIVPSHLDQGNLANEVRSGRLFLAAPGSGNAYRVTALRKLMPLPVTQEERHGADFFAGYGCALVGAVRALDEALGCYRVHRVQDVDNLCFGNARLGMTESQMLRSRFARFRSWIARALPEEKLAMHVKPDFSILKQDFAIAIFGDPGYLKGIRKGAAQLPGLASSILSRTTPAHVKAALLAWAMFVLIAPRSVGEPVARYICNPASRKQSHT